MINISKYAKDKLTSIVEGILAGPNGAALLEQAREADVDRAAIAAQLAETIKQQDAAYARHEAESAPLKARVDAVAAKLEIARENYGACGLAYYLESQTLYSQNERLRNQLRDSAPSAIAAFRGSMDEDIARTWASVEVRTAQTISGRDVSWSNHASAAARCTAARDAKNLAAELMYEVLSDEAMTARLDALRDGLPDVAPTPVEPPRDLLSQGGRHAHAAV